MSARRDLKDWVIMLHVGLAVDTILYLIVRYHDNAALVVAALPTLPAILGLYHMFSVRDDKIPDACQPYSPQEAAQILGDV
jgi:hypothetical protein